MLRIWRRDETILYSNDPEGETRRSILLAILKELRFDLGFLRSWSGDETTSAILQGLRDDIRFWLLCRGVGKILGFENSKKVKNQTFLFMDRFGYFLNSIFLKGCRCEISGQRAPARHAVKFGTLKHLVWVERGLGRAGRVTLGDASRPAHYKPHRATTDRIVQAEHIGFAPQEKHRPPKAWPTQQSELGLRTNPSLGYHGNATI